MARSFKRATAAIDAEADAVCALLNGGKLRIYTGAQPGSADAPLNGQTLLAELGFGAPAFAAAVAGMATANAIAKDDDAKASGTAAWFRCVTAGGAPVLDGSVGLADCTLNVPSVAFHQHAEISVTSFSYLARQE
jgi:hypothetical protein